MKQLDIKYYSDNKIKKILNYPGTQVSNQVRKIIEQLIAERNDLETICQQLQEDNLILQKILNTLNG